MTVDERVVADGWGTREWLARPDVAGRYELGDVIGLGSAATVYRAWDRYLGRYVAVKLYESGTSGVVADRPQHLAELEALSGLRHPRLVALYDAGTHGDQAFVVQQLIDGEPLSRRIARGKLTVDATVEIGAQLARALAHVHANRVIHRDVKPANVLVDTADRCYLTDFGVSRFVDATRCTATGIALGTPAFLSPEQVKGARLTPAVDIYALGLLLLEGLTGAREYPGGPVESAVARLHRPPKLPSGLPRRLRTLLRRMTAAEPGDRPDAVEVGVRLDALLRGRRKPRPAAADPARLLLFRGPRLQLSTLATAGVVIALCSGVVASDRPDPVVGNLAARQTAADEPAVVRPAAAPGGHGSAGHLGASTPVADSATGADDEGDDDDAAGDTGPASRGEADGSTATARKSTASAATGGAIPALPPGHQVQRRAARAAAAAGAAAAPGRVAERARAELAGRVGPQVRTASEAGVRAAAEAVRAARGDEPDQPDRSPKSAAGAKSGAKPGRSKSGSGSDADSGSKSGSGAKSGSRSEPEGGSESGSSSGAKQKSQPATTAATSSEQRSGQGSGQADESADRAANQGSDPASTPERKGPLRATAEFVGETVRRLTGVGTTG